MSKRFLNGTEWTAMIMAGAERLSGNVDRVNALNVFPVPDGDTGTNMNLTMSAGVAELNHKPSDEVGRAAEVLSKGLLMGARGNSGVILSQLFRGFSRAVTGQKELTVPLFANALQQGVDTAYKAVVKPVEGTILTVAREAARHGLTSARRVTDLTEWMHDVLAKAQETLARTQEMLPVLKQVGVVDSGGQGLVYLYEGFAAYLGGGQFATGDVPQLAKAPSASVRASSAAAAPAVTATPVRNAGTANVTAQSKITTESIAFPYDMEFFIQRASNSSPFPERSFRQALERDGDSIILIEDDDIVKVHVHSRRPGDVMNYALTHGAITHIHILNMQEQHKDLLAQQTESHPVTPTSIPFFGIPEAPASGAKNVDYALPGVVNLPSVTASPESVPNPDVYEMAEYGVVAVSVGEGNAELFRSLGVDIVLSGGQSMNPSTEDLLGAIASLSAHHVFLLPNNPNIIMAAKQAAELAERPVTVLPTRTLPQGMAAMLAFQETDGEAANAERMTKAFERVVTGQVTQAVRDTEMDGLQIRQGHFIGIKDKTIVASAPSQIEACEALLSELLVSGGEILTILTGEDADPDQTEALETWLAEIFPNVEVETHEGGQPLYTYLFAVEP
ncbi:DAK2 domain-containing protein [Cohnella endophytica]|uniref:DAK2 domain-containing protein n=1 Tax=Cohnella endophytica TaxID=2419778 RepID=A0A494Y510_9BACL|nr:DAK2 domain-containing protein [Cohnella endophytica]RKP55386.1 DAK2 domain-containing protein [Cohnella endophytica]